MNGTNLSRKCLACRHEMDDAFSPTHKDATPKPSNIAICIRCGHLMAYADDLSFRELNDDEMRKVAGNKEILRIQKARALANKLAVAVAANHERVLTAPMESIWAVLAVNPDGNEGIMASMDIRTGAATPFVCSEEKHIPKIVEMAKATPFQGLKMRLVKFDRADVLQEFEPDA
jgi:hypothetical protein